MGFPGLKWERRPDDRPPHGAKTALKGRCGLPVAFLSIFFVLLAAAGSDYRVQASAGGGLIATRETDFTLAASVASLSVSGISVSGIGETSAQVMATLSTVPGNPVVYFRYREQDGESWQPAQTVTSASGSAALTLTGLDKDTRYQVAASLLSDFSTGRTVNFKTLTNLAPRFASSSVDLQVENHSPEGGPVGSPMTAEDTDPLTYSLGGTDAASFDLDASTGQITVGSGVTLDRTVKVSHTVTVTARDPDGATATATVAIEVVFPRYVEPVAVAGVGLLDRVCGSAIPGAAGIPGCPVTLVPLMPLIGLGLLLSLGVRNPMVLGGVAVGAAAATSVAISPNPLMISLLVLAALSVVIGVGWLRKV